MPFQVLGSGSFARRCFPGRDVPAHNPYPSLRTDLLTRSHFSRGSQALIKTFPLELARVQPAGYSSCHGAPVGPLGAGSWEAPAEPASGTTALGQGSEGAALSVTAFKVRENSISWPRSTIGFVSWRIHCHGWSPWADATQFWHSRAMLWGRGDRASSSQVLTPASLLSSCPQVAMDCPTPMVSCSVVSSCVLSPRGSTGYHHDFVATDPWGGVRDIPLPG